MSNRELKFMVLFFSVSLIILQHFYWKYKYLAGVVTILSAGLGFGMVFIPTYVIEPKSDRYYQEIGMCFIFLAIFSLIFWIVIGYTKRDTQKMQKIMEQIWSETDALDGHDFFDARILEIHTDYFLVQVMEDDLTETNEITVSNHVIKAEEFPADLSVGEIVRIGFLDIDEDRKIQIENPYGIFRLDSDRFKK